MMITALVSFPVEDLRMMERLLAVTFGGMSLYLGYRLFLVGATDAQVGDIDLAGKLKIRAKAFAPGIFFAAFGACIVTISLISRVRTESGSLPTGTNAALALNPGNFLGVLGGLPAIGNPNAAMRQIQAINTLVLPARELSRAATPEGMRTSKAVTELETLRLELLDRILGAGAADRFGTISEAIRRNPGHEATMSADDKQFYANAKRTLEAGY